MVKNEMTIGGYEKRGAALARGLVWLGVLWLGGAALALRAEAQGHGHDSTHPAAGGLAAGPVQELVLPEGLNSPQSMAIDPVGRLWFSEKVGKKLAMYDPDKKSFSIFSLPESWGKVGFSQVTAGPKGEIWFTVNRWAEGSEEPHLLGRFTPEDGYFTKLAVPHRAIPQELMVDRQGVIWFFAANKNHLYRVDPQTFALKGFPLPTANGHPRSLAEAPDGHIWFVEANTNKIGEFDPAKNQFLEHEVLTSFSNPGRLSIDAQGRVWFVEVTANRIGVFTPQKKRFDEVIVPTPGSAPVALVNDAQGSIWFLQYKGNKVGYFNPQTAQFREYDIPTYGSLPAELVLDRGRGRLWFTESATDAKRLGTLAIEEALRSGVPLSGQARLPPAPAAAPSDLTRNGWAVLAGLALLLGAGTWLAARALRRRQA